MRASLVELDLKLAIARPIVGSIWRHTKSGVIYQIVGVSIEEKSGDVLYTYQPMTGPGLSTDVLFSRPAWEWEITPEGETAPRFERIPVYAAD